MSRTDQRRAAGKARRARDKLTGSELVGKYDSDTVVIGNISTNHGSSLSQLRYVAQLSATHPVNIALPHGRPYSLLQFGSTACAASYVQQLDQAWIPELGLCLAVGLANLANTELNIHLHHRDIWQPLATSSPQPVALPDGLQLIPEFVSALEAEALLAELESDSCLFQPLRTRTVAQWGYAFDYDTFGAVALPNPVPSLTQQLMARLPYVNLPSDVVPLTTPALSLFGPFTPPNQCTLNRYIPGDGIPAHADDPSVFGQAIWILSLGQPLAMEFAPLVLEHPESAAVLDPVTPHSAVTDATTANPSLESSAETQTASDFGAVNQGKSTQGRVRDLSRSMSVWLPSRSLLVMTGASRYDWTHGIAQRKTDMADGEVRARGTRTSLTFRHVLTHATPS